MKQKSSKKKAIHKPLQIKKSNSLQWILEPLEHRPDFIQKKMFGCLAGYLGDRLVLVLADSDEPWNGLLIPTEREHHSAIQSEFEDCLPHSILGKWLYLPQNTSNFEEASLKIVEYVQSEDPRFGVNPKPKRIKGKKKSSKK